MGGIYWYLTSINLDGNMVFCVNGVGTLVALVVRVLVIFCVLDYCQVLFLTLCRIILRILEVLKRISRIVLRILNVLEYFQVLIVTLCRIILRILVVLKRIIVCLL